MHGAVKWIDSTVGCSPFHAMYRDRIFVVLVFLFAGTVVSRLGPILCVCVCLYELD